LLSWIDWTRNLGTYPEITLAGAREKRDACRKLIANDIEPTLQRKAKKVPLLTERLTASKSLHANGST
jgi:hypothetical protein